MRQVRPLWLPEDDEWLRRLWEVDNMTSGQCAKVMGVTRNSIIGRAMRLGLKHSGPITFDVASSPHVGHTRTVRAGSKKAEIIYSSEQPRKRLRRSNYANSRTVVIEDVEEACDLPPDQSDFAVALFDLEPRHCRWPLGEGPAQMFCGAAKVSGHPYCPRHGNMAYKKSPNRVTDEERARRATHWRKITKSYKADRLLDIGDGD